jgi:hypothetical protein
MRTGPWPRSPTRASGNARVVHLLDDGAQAKARLAIATSVGANDEVGIPQRARRLPCQRHGRRAVPGQPARSMRPHRLQRAARFPADPDTRPLVVHPDDGETGTRRAAVHLRLRDLSQPRRAGARAQGDAPVEDQDQVAHGRGPGGPERAARGQGDRPARQQDQNEVEPAHHGRAEAAAPLRHDRRPQGQERNDLPAGAPAHEVRQQNASAREPEPEAGGG